MANPLPRAGWAWHGMAHPLFHCCQVWDPDLRAPLGYDASFLAGAGSSFALGSAFFSFAFSCSFSFSGSLAFSAAVFLSLAERTSWMSSYWTGVRLYRGSQGVVALSLIVPSKNLGITEVTLGS